MREFGRGVGILLRGFGWWRRRPALMALGLLPALVVGAVLATGIVVLTLHLPALADAATPFADSWDGTWQTVIRVVVGTAILGSALVLSAITFTALTLLVGEPVYERIWRGIERELGGDAPDVAYGFWRSIADAVSLIARGALAALAAALLGLVPGVGGILSFVTGALLTGWLLADELTSRALVARGIDRAGRKALVRGHRARMLGFGVATQLCFLVPLGAVLAMPVAVAASTQLARSILPADPSRPADPPRPGPPVTTRPQATPRPAG